MFINPESIKLRKCNFLLSGIILFIGIIYTIIYYYMPYSGDDLEGLVLFTGWYEGTGPFDPIWDYPHKGIARHWKWINGRIADMFNPFMLLMFPHWLNALFNSIGICAMFALTSCMCQFRRNYMTGRIILLAILVFAFPWWDSMQVFDCIYNYVFSSALGLLFLYQFINRSEQYMPKKWLILFAWCLLFFISGGMHEACGVPLCCGIIAYFIRSGKYASLSKYKKYITWSFFGGALFCFASPGIWGRLERMGEPNDPMGWLVLKSDTIALIMLAAVIIGLCFKSTRSRLMELSRTEWIIFFIAAVASLCFSALSGIVGRSGWFANLFALIAIFKWINGYAIKMSKIPDVMISMTLILIMVFHFIEFARYQIKFGRDHEEMLTLYNSSPNGIIYMDAKYETDIPWWILSKTRGVPDADDIHLIYQINNYYSGKTKRLVVLPKEVENLDWKTISGKKHLSSGGYITNVAPFDVSMPYVLNYIFKIGDQWWVGVPFVIDSKTYYHIVPRFLDPGDR